MNPQVETAGLDLEQTSDEDQNQNQMISEDLYPRFCYSVPAVILEKQGCQEAESLGFPERQPTKT